MTSETELTNMCLRAQLEILQEIINDLKHPLEHCIFKNNNYGIHKFTELKINYTNWYNELKGEIKE